MYRHISKTLILFVSLLLIGSFLTGCNVAKTQADKPADSPSTTAPTPETNPPASVDTLPDPSPQSQKVTLYFPNSDASGLIATDRTIVVNDQEVIKSIFKELANPPSGLVQPLPQGTNLLGATVSADGVATIDLSSEFQTNFGGGSAGEQMTMYSIINTLTTLPNVQSVQFLLEGKKLDGILGNLDTSLPLMPNEGLILKKN